MKQYKSAIIGCGNVGLKFNMDYDIGFTSTHYEAHTKNKNIKLVTVSDLINPHINEPQSTDLMWYQDYKEMMEKEQPEIVSIATPDETHYDILMEVAKYNCVKGIWCEKPLGVTVRQAKRMTYICKTTNIKLVVNHIRRYDKFYQIIKRRLKSLVGDGKKITCYYSGGNVTVGSHLFDLLCYLLGDCDYILDPNTLLFKDGSFVTLCPSDDLKYPIFQLSIIGSKGKLDTMNKPFGNYDYQYTPLQKDDITGLRYLGSNTKDVIDRDLERNFFDNALADLIKCINTGKEPLSSGAESSKSLEIIAGIEVSRKTGKRIHIPISTSHWREKIPFAIGDVKKWQKK